MSNRVRVLNASFDPLTLESAIESMFASIGEGTAGWMCTVNTAVLMMMRSQPMLQRHVDGARWVVADGQPIVWASRLLRRPLPGRVAGIDLIDPMCARARQDGQGVFLLGSTDEIVAGLTEDLRHRHPGLAIAGSSGYFSEDEAEHRADEVRRTGASILFVGMGVPRQEEFMHEQWERFGVNVAIGVGGSFDVLVGVRRRAPRWMQAIGMEWAFRLVQEPRRLFRRYLVTGFQFVALVARAVIVPNHRSR